MGFMLHYKYSEFQILKFPIMGDKFYTHLEVDDDSPLHAYSKDH
jgi:hypothetical protein